MADPTQVLGFESPKADAATPSRRSVSTVPSSGLVQALTVVGALVVGFLLAVGLTTGHNAARAEDARKAALVALVKSRQERAERLSEQLEQLRAQVAAAESQTAAGLPVLNAQLRALEAAAGMTALRGPGLRVTLADAAGTCATGSQEDCRIQDVDLQLAVNRLFAAGAEGVAVNGERVIATTAIRSAGGSVLVNYRVLTSPYVIEAVGGRSALEREFGQSDLARDFEIWRDQYGLRFSVEPVEEIEVPPYAGSIRLRAASPPARPSPPAEVRDPR